MVGGGPLAGIVSTGIPTAAAIWVTFWIVTPRPLPSRARNWYALNSSEPVRGLTKGWSPLGSV
jgi:hypothetical protein